MRTRIALTVLLASLALLPLGTAHAEPVPAFIQVSAPFESEVGDIVEVQVLLFATSGPVTGAQVVLYERVQFLDADPRDIPVASSTTSENGVAIIRYAAKRDGLRLMFVEFEGSREYAAVTLPLEMTISGHAQTYVEEPLSLVPGLNRFFVMTILGAVWATMLFVVAHLGAIAYAGARNQPEDESEGQVAS